MGRWRWPLLSVASLLVSGCAEPVGLQVFKSDDIVRYLHQNHFDVDSWGVDDGYWQDAKGEALYIAYQAAAGYHLLLLRPRQDKIEIMDLTFNAGSGLSWDNPQGNTQPLPSYAYVARFPDVDTYVDKQSGYFYQRIIKDHAAHIGHMEGHGWLFSVQETDHFRVDQVCARGDVIYLLDHRDRGNPMFAHWRKNCWMFMPDPRDPKQYVKVSEFSVPGVVRIVDPFSPRFICDGYGYMPFPGHPFLYDTQAHRTIGLLPFNHVILFLSRDWLSPQLKAK